MAPPVEADLIEQELTVYHEWQEAFLRGDENGPACPHLTRPRVSQLSLEPLQHVLSSFYSLGSAGGSQRRRFRYGLLARLSISIASRLNLRAAA